jgi:hypothetical protein
MARVPRLISGSIQRSLPRRFERRTRPRRRAAPAGCRSDRQPWMRMAKTGPAPGSSRRIVTPRGGRKPAFVQACRRALRGLLRTQVHASGVFATLIDRGRSDPVASRAFHAPARAAVTSITPNLVVSGIRRPRLRNSIHINRDNRPEARWRDSRRSTGPVRRTPHAGHEATPVDDRGRVLYLVSVSRPRPARTRPARMTARAAPAGGSQRRPAAAVPVGRRRSPGCSGC